MESNELDADELLPEKARNISPLGIAQRPGILRAAGIGEVIRT